MIPPSTTNSVPVIHDDSSDANYSAAYAMSSGSAIWLTIVPKTDTVCPPHSRMKSECPQSPPNRRFTAPHILSSGDDSVPTGIGSDGNLRKHECAALMKMRVYSAWTLASSKAILLTSAHG